MAHFRNTLVIVVVLCILAACQSSDQAAKEREKFGIELFEKGDYSKAKLEFSSALKEDGTLARTFYYLALIDEKNRNFRAMRQNLIHTIQLDSENIEARNKLGRVHLIFNDMDLALTEADEILKYSKDNLEGLSLKAAVFVKQKKQGKALEIIDNILQIQPQYIEAISLKALILMQNEQFDNALMLVKPVIDSGVDDISLHLLKIQLDAKQKDIEAVIADYERLSKLYPDKHAFKFALAKIYSQANKKQEAETLLRQVVKSAPLEIKPKIVLLDFLNSISKQKSVEQIKKYTSENKNKPDLLFEISQWLMLKKFFSEAQALLVKIDALVGDNDQEQHQQVKLLLANIDFHNKDFDKSISKIDELLTINSENLQAKILRAKIHIAQEQFDEAVALLTKILWAAPRSDESLVLLAQIELLKGFPEKADKKFREALEVNPINMKALISVINRSMRNKNIDYASELLTTALKLQPNNLPLLKAAIEINIASRNWEGAKEILKSLEKQSQGSLLAKFLTGRVYQEQGDCTQAVSIFKQVLSIASNYPDVLRQMATCYELMKQRPEMIAYISSFIEKTPKNISAYLISGELFLLNKNVEKALATYEQALAINKKIPQIYAALARLYTLQGENKKTIEIYLQGLEEIPNNVRLSIQLASLYEDENEVEKAVKLYQSLLAVTPKLGIAINNYAALLTEIMGDKQSLEKARQILVSFVHSENPYYLDSYAWVELKLGNLKVALPLLEKVNVMANLPVFKYHLAVAYHKQGNKAGAVAQLQQAIEIGKQKGGFTEIKQAQQLLDELSIANKL